MPDLPTVARKEILTFTATAFQSLEQPLEGPLKELFDLHYLWTSVRRLTKREREFLDINGTAVEIRPKNSTENFVISRQIYGFEVVNRSVLFMRRKEILGQQIEKRAVRGPLFRDLRRQLLEAAKELEIPFFKGSIIHRELPNWTSLSLQDRYALDRVMDEELATLGIQLPALHLFPENEILAPRHFICGRREHKSPHRKSRFAFHIQEYPSPKPH